MSQSETEPKMKTAKRAPKNGSQAPADPFAVIDEMREAFKDVPPEEVEAEVARAIREGREQSRRSQPPAPRRA